MKKQIESLQNFLKFSENIEEAAKKLSDKEKRLSVKAAKNVLLDVQDYNDAKITEQELSLFLVSNGF